MTLLRLGIWHLSGENASNIRTSPSLITLRDGSSVEHLPKVIESEPNWDSVVVFEVTKSHKAVVPGSHFTIDLWQLQG